MDLAVLDLLAPLFVFVGLTGAVLVGMKMRYTHIQRTRLSGSAHQDVARLAEAVDTMRDEVHVLRDEVSIMREDVLSINERVDFTERLLERPKADRDLDALPGRQD